MKIAVYDDKDAFLTEDTEQVSDDKYNLYIFNLRAAKQNKKQIINIRKLQDDENLQWIHYQNEDQLQSQVAKYKKKLEKLREAYQNNIVPELKHHFKQDEDEIQSMIADAIFELKNDIQNEGAIPVFKIVLASDAMINYIMETMREDGKQVLFFNKVKLTEAEKKAKYAELMERKSKLAMIKAGSKKIVADITKTLS